MYLPFSDLFWSNRNSVYFQNQSENVFWKSVDSFPVNWSKIRCVWICLRVKRFAWKMFCHDRYGVSGNSAKSCVHTHKYFPDLLKSNRNQVVFTIFRVIWNQTDRIRLLFQINPKMVNTILFRFDFIRFRKNSLCAENYLLNGWPFVVSMSILLWRIIFIFRFP